MKISGVDDMARVAEALLGMGPKAVLVKGGHLENMETVCDILVTKDSDWAFEAGRIDTTNTHGTGCTLASAIACSIAQGMDLPDAVARAQAYVIEAIRTNPGFGGGHGPLNHAHTVSDFKG